MGEGKQQDCEMRNAAATGDACIDVVSEGRWSRRRDNRMVFLNRRLQQRLVVEVEFLLFLVSIEFNSSNQQTFLFASTSFCLSVYLTGEKTRANHTN